MIRLFFKFSIATILLGFLFRSFFYSYLESQVFTDRDRVLPGMTQVHVGGLRVLAKELKIGDEETRKNRLQLVQQEFSAPIEIRELAELTHSNRRLLAKNDGFIHSYSANIIDYLGVPFDETHYLRLGPIANRFNSTIEAEAVDWLRIIAKKLETTDQPAEELQRISKVAQIQVSLIPQGEIPEEAIRRIGEIGTPTFYSYAKNYFVLMPIKNTQDLLRLGPLPEVRTTANAINNFTMGLWLSSILLSTGWLVYNLANKFKRIEQAALRISQGRFDTRVDATQAGESSVLANAFNLMAERTESSIQSKDELLQIVSHELRTPLSRLRFAVELLEVSKDDEAKKARMTIIRQSIDNLNAIVDEVFEYMKNEDKDLVKSREKIEIERSLLPVLELFRIDHPEIQFLWNVQGASNLHDIYADRVEFHRAIGNLLSNAFRFAKSQVQIHVYAISDAVCVDIEDDGPGIPKEKRLDVIKPFFRLVPQVSHKSGDSSHQDSTLKGRPIYENSSGGLGLGLAIVDRILKQHGGSLSFDQGQLGGCLAKTSWPNTSTTPSH